MDKLAPTQKKFVKLVNNPRIAEAERTARGYLVATRYGKIAFEAADIDPLLEEGYLIESPSRWNPQRMYVTINVTRKDELVEMARKKTPRPRYQTWYTPAQKRMLMYLIYTGPIDIDNTEPWCKVRGRTLRTAKALIKRGDAVIEGTLIRYKER